MSARRSAKKKSAVKKARTPALNDGETMEMLLNKENFKVKKLIFIVNKWTVQNSHCQ